MKMHHFLETAATVPSVPWQGDYYFYHYADHQSSAHRHMHGDIKVLQLLNTHVTFLLMAVSYEHRYTYKGME